MSKVTIEHHRGLFRLRWHHSGKRHILSLGVRDHAIGRGMAQMKASQIERDIAAGYFDTTLLRYKPRTRGKNATELSCPELFGAYTQAMGKDKGLSPGSLCRYNGVLANLNRSLNVEAHTVTQQRAGNLAALIMEQVSDRTAKEYLWLLESCWQWAAGKYHVGESNPWAGLASKIKASTRQKVKPFTDAEVKAILAAFKTDQYYAHYYPMVAFLFGSGCRFGEMAGLKWRHLSQDFSMAWKKTVLAGTAKDKDAAIEYCRRAFPQVSLLPGPRCRKPHDGMADALCLLEYGRRVLVGQILG